MTKNEFLLTFDRGIAQLPKEEREKQKNYYSEMIDDRMEDGMTEEEAVANLGNPADVARQILEVTPLGTLVKTRVKPSGGWTVAGIIIAILGSPVWVPILLAVLSAVLAFYVSLWSVVAAIAAVVLGLLAGSLACIVLPFFALGSVGIGPVLLLVGCGIFGLALTALGILIAYYVAKAITKLTVLVAKWMKSLFIRKETAA